ncbi:MAG: GTP-binding protein [Oscillospiraceae bacterium]|nr:GTP-binding protein [Oscillospiraceae bacterium]
MDTENGNDAEEESTPLNELKVVFLGDGGAGKSHTIARLMANGGQTEDFPDISTPGIVIQDKTYPYDDKEVKVHFWDFGGQEILHSMHRMFLTTRTLYVVMLNVRDGTQDDRARYWLYNLRSFAKGAPVLLVLNQMDMNENATLNESDLRKLYPTLAPDVVKISTLKYSDGEFEEKFINVLRRQIGSMDILAFPFIPAWSRLKEKLQNMEDYYIDGDKFREFCDECGVTDSDNIRRDLLNWFSDLGVSFCYSGSASLEDYVVLRPDWITNAIYIVLFNKAETANNGQVSHEVIYKMLSSRDMEKYRRTVTKATYKPHEVDYVLKVFRKFRLSFLAEDGIEFLPMLCEANAKPISATYENDPDALEFRMHYEYLPNNVIHRLMVDRRRELNLSNVWLYGGQFRNDCTGLSAVVKTEGNLLRIMVRRENSACAPQLYLDALKKDIERINAEMGLTAHRTEVVYKQGTVVECFSYKTLLNYQKLGQQYIVSEELGELIPVADILKQSGHSADRAQEELVTDIVQFCEMLQDNNKIWDGSEDERTTYIRDLLRAKGYIANDQTRGGISGGDGEQAGELDLDIRLKPAERLTIFEALNLKGSAESYRRYWNAHLDKLLDNYNSTGCPFLFHVTYLSCAKDAFAKHCVTFEDHMRYYSPRGFSLTSERPTDPLAKRNIRHGGFLRAMECVYDCGGIPMTVYHFFVRIGE